ncbi:hypothetical protein [Ornithinibacillus sp. JPR2-1]|uniref:hypothetical protein n=1 Tax=Ornithinibacillus sp. JPR2-1 TaxID=2094019 RepID=UPI0031DB1550
MAQIKLIDENTDLSKLKNPVGWDLEIKGVPYDVYRVDGYIHTIGGKFGENCYWACPAGANPSYYNLIEFNGDAPTWGVIFDRVNYTKNKWGEKSVEANGNCWITRNGKNFYRVPARYLDYGLAKAQYLLVKLLEECPLWLAERKWKENAIGRKIWYQNQPAKITRINDENELWVVPDGIDRFIAPAHWNGIMGWDSYSEGLYVDLLSEDIYWFRD